MSNINIYKIDNERQNSFLKFLQERMEKVNENPVSVCRQGQNFEADFYLLKSTKTSLSWEWILEIFKVPSIETFSMPRAVLVLSSKNNIYAITFGLAFFCVDKYCDNNFGFNFARKVEFEKIKTTTLIIPNSKRNKTVNTYIDFSELICESGTSYAKIKANVVQENKKDALFNPSLEVGNSIRLTTAEKSLERIVDIILSIEDTIKNKEDKYKIPLFYKIKDETKINTLDQKLNDKINQDMELQISELDIIGASEIFNNNDNQYTLKYKKNCRKVTDLDNETIYEFFHQCKTKGIKNILDIEVQFYRAEETVVTKSLKDLIIYTDDEERCTFYNGKWHEYNKDYIDYLHDSLSGIPAIHDKTYDFSNKQYEAYIEEKNKQNISSSPKQSTSKSKKKPYYEKAFNDFLEEKHGFKNFDCDLVNISNTNSKIEVMDLYKDEMMISVKSGKSSGKLCYLVTQSLTALKCYQNGLLKEKFPRIETVVLWIILERQHLEEKNGKPNINQLDMFALKHQIDHWQKEVRLAGFKPMIFINYRD